MKIVLGVSGSVACYRACDMARELMRRGHEVRACLTDSAQQFVTAALFEALTGQPCLTGVFEEPVRGRMAHIDWARHADLLLVAPATANTINKLASGLSDDMLTTINLAFDGSVVVCPAMNPTMFQDETTQKSLRVLAERGVWIVEPDSGEVACGEQGQGKLASTEKIVKTVMEVGTLTSLLNGKTVLITSGPTQEPIDDVRFLTNRSSGKMGAALTRAALLMGAKVTVVSGPTAVPLSQLASIERVQTADEMLEASLRHAPDADIIIGAAAVSDYKVANRHAGKLRREDGVPEISLAPNPDIIGTLAKSAKPGAILVAFAAEPGTDLTPAREKLARKGVQAIAVNDVSDPGIGFEGDENQLTLVTENQEWTSPRTSKTECARWLLEKIAVL